MDAKAQMRIRDMRENIKKKANYEIDEKGDTVGALSYALILATMADTLDIAGYTKLAIPCRNAALEIYSTVNKIKEQDG